MTDGRVVLVTVPDRDAALRLCRTLVEEGLAACGNIIPEITSIYRWEGEIREDAEVIVIFKTREAAVAGLLRRVAEVHPYEVPEILALPVESGHAPYLAWVRESTQAGD